MQTGLQILTFAHVLAVVFMAWPLYALITVNERGKLGSPLGEWADRYMENLVKAGALRCYIYQLTAGATGVALVYFRGLPLSYIFTNWVLLAKAVLLLTLMSLLSYVHFSLQPRIDALFAQAGTNAAPEDLGAQVGPLRLRRKRLAATCLFLVIITVLLGVQVYARFNPLLTLLLIVLSVLFVWRAYRTSVRFGWV